MSGMLYCASAASCRYCAGSQEPWKAEFEGDFGDGDDIKAIAFRACVKGKHVALNPTRQRLVVAGSTEAKRNTAQAKVKAKAKAAKAKAKAKGTAKAGPTATGKAKAKAKAKAKSKACFVEVVT